MACTSFGVLQKKKIENVQLLQIECMAKERGGEKGRIFKEPVYMLWALARQISPGQYGKTGDRKPQGLLLRSFDWLRSLIWLAVISFT